MRISRAPEYRGGSGSPIVLILVLLAVLIVGGVVIYLLLGNNNMVSPAPAAPAAAVTQAQTAPALRQPQALPTLAPPQQVQPQAAPPVAANPEPVAQDTMAGAYQAPEVLYGEVLAEGFVDLELLTGRVRTFYTFQVDTSTQNIVLFFGLYSPAGDAISRSVVVEGYSQSHLITNAELTVYYPDAPATIIRFDRETGTVVSSQFYTTQPHGPGIFSPQMRIALIKQNLPLNNADGTITAAMQLDPTGVADLSGYQVIQVDPVTTETALTEIQALIDQLESRRPRS